MTFRALRKTLWNGASRCCHARRTVLHVLYLNLWNLKNKPLDRTCATCVPKNCFQRPSMWMKWTEEGFTIVSYLKQMLWERKVRDLPLSLYIMAAFCFSRQELSRDLGAARNHAGAWSRILAPGFGRGGPCLEFLRFSGLSAHSTLPSNRLS